MFVKMKREREKDDASHGVSEYIWVCVMLTVVVLGGLLVGWWLTAAACLMLLVITVASSLGSERCFSVHVFCSFLHTLRSYVGKY